MALGDISDRSRDAARSIFEHLTVGACALAHICVRAATSVGFFDGTAFFDSRPQLAGAILLKTGARYVHKQSILNPADPAERKCSADFSADARPSANQPC